MLLDVELTKVCNACKVEKSLGNFYKHSRGKYGLRAICKPCYKQYADQHYQNKKEVISEQNHAYREANKDKVTERERAYRESNKDKITKRMNAYCKANPHIYSANTAKRKASKIKATPVWANKEAIKDMYQLATIFKRTGINMHVDHIIPLQSKLVCGLHCEANLQLMPAYENKSKGNYHWPDMPV